MRSMIRPACVLLVLVFAIPALADEKPINTDDQTKQICKKTETTGTRLGFKRVCKSKAEWDFIAAEAQDDLRRTIELGSASTPR